MFFFFKFVLTDTMSRQFVESQFSEVVVAFTYAGSIGNLCSFGLIFLSFIDLAPYCYLRIKEA